jgi:hypothetical protein
LASEGVSTWANARLCRDILLAVLATYYFEFRITGMMTLFLSFGFSISNFDFSFFHLNSRRHKLGAYEYRRYRHRQ